VLSQLGYEAAAVPKVAPKDASVIAKRRKDLNGCVFAHRNQLLESGLLLRSIVCRALKLKAKHR
jgi:hypothetical protein